MTDSVHLANADSSRVQGHTPGPWSYNEAGLPSLSLYGSDNKGLWHMSRTDAENKANCLLIAAAPELLEALQDMLRLADAEGWEGFPKARAAIAKATGAA